MDLVTLAIAYLAGMVLPGWPAARLLGVRPLWCGALVLTWSSLIGGILIVQAVGLPFNFPVILAWQSAMTAAAWIAWRWRQRRQPPDLTPPEPSSFTAAQRGTLVGMVALFAAVHLWRLIQAPLSGADTLFRWDHLARMMLEQGNLDFYPPATPGDYRVYFFPDALAPVVSGVYAWFYAGWGQAAAWITVPFVWAQWLATLGFTHRAASNLAGRSAGLFAVALLAASGFVFRAIGIGQDMGAITLAIAGGWAVLSEHRPRGTLDGLAAALVVIPGVMVREYGPVVGLLSIALLLRRPMPWQALLTCCALLMLMAAPWYLRNLLRLGHPLHSLPLPGFHAAAPVHADILRVYAQRTIAASEWRQAAGLIFSFAPVAATVGLATSFALLRRLPHLALAILAFVAVWLSSVAYTSGGVGYSARLLAPAMVLGVLATAVWSAPLLRDAVSRSIVVGLLVAHGLWGLAHAAAFPFNLTIHDWRRWPAALAATLPTRPESLVAEHLRERLPPGTRILTDNAFAHVHLRRVGLEAVPLWSPEVAFVFDGRTPPRQVRQRLRALGIHHVLLYPRSLNTIYCMRQPFYQLDLPQWRLVVKSRDQAMLLLGMPQGPDVEDPSLANPPPFGDDQGGPQYGPSTDDATSSGSARPALAQ